MGVQRPNIGTARKPGYTLNWDPAPICSRECAFEKAAISMTYRIDDFGPQIGIA
jgi:hypothetical protein